MRALSFLILAVLIWGAQPLVIKLALSVFSVGFAAFARSAVAAVFFGAVGLASRRGLASQPAEVRVRGGRLVAWLAAGGLGLGLGNVLWNASLTRTTVGASSVLQMAGNLVLALYGVVILRESFGPLRRTGLLLALLGMFLVSWNGQDLSALVSSRFSQGNALALASGLAWGLCAVAQKVSVPGRSSVLVSIPIFTLSALICGSATLAGPVLVGPFRLAMLTALLLTGLLGMGLGNILFTESMRSVTASAGAAALTAAPLVTVGLAAALLHERATVYLLVGAPFTCAGVAAVLASEPATARHQPTPWEEVRPSGRQT